MKNKSLNSVKHEIDTLKFSFEVNGKDSRLRDFDRCAYLTSYLLDLEKQPAAPSPLVRRNGEGVQSQPGPPR